MPELLALAPIVVALLIILVALAVWVLAELLARVLQHAPFIGSWIGNEVRSLADTAGKYIVATWDTSTSALGWAFQTIMWHTWHALYAAGQAIEHGIKLGAKAEQDVTNLAAQLPHAVNAGVATAEAAASSLVAQAVHGLDDTIVNRVAAAEAIAATAVAGLASTVVSDVEVIDGKISTLGGQLVSDVAGLASRLAALEAALSGDVTSLVGQIQGDLNVAIATAEADAQAALAAANQAAVTIASAAAGTAVGALDQAAHDLVIGPWQALLPELERLVGALPLPEVQALGLPGVLTPSLPLTIPGILATLAPAIAAVLSEVTTCVTPNCGPIKELGGLMNGLEKVGLAGLLFALVAEAVADPQRAAGDIVASLGWASDLSTEFVGAVLG